MRKYITEHRTEFLPEGIDPAEADHEAEIEEAALSPTAAENTDSAARANPQAPSSRGLQWALDTFDGASKVAKDSFTGALDIIGDAISGLDLGSFNFSRTTVLTLTIAVLVVSNVYTILTMGEREAIGRRKALEKRDGERDQWVGEAVRAFIEVQRSMGAIPNPPAPVSPSAATSSTELPITAIETSEPVPTAAEDIKAELRNLFEKAASLEQRVAALRNQLEELD